jgi:hypothetical protein
MMTLTVACVCVCGLHKYTPFSIEDPFETWYDIAHVIKGPQMSHIRKEFLV